MTADYEAREELARLGTRVDHIASTVAEIRDDARACRVLLAGNGGGGICQRVALLEAGRIGRTRLYVALIGAAATLGAALGTWIAS